MYAKYEHSIFIFFPETTKRIRAPHISLTWTNRDPHLYGNTHTHNNMCIYIRATTGLCPSVAA